MGVDFLVEAVYRDDTHGSTSWEVMGGQKRFLRRWDESGRWEWSWILNEHAQLVRRS